MRASLIACTVLMILSLATPALAGFYECRDANGRVSFQDRPCPSGMETRERGKPERVSERKPAASDGSPPEAPVRPLVTTIMAPARVPADKRYVIDRSLLEGEEWQALMTVAREKHRHGTVVRVFLEHATEFDLIQAVAGKLSNPSQLGGGGRYREFPSGTFLFVEHQGGTAESGRELLALGNVLHGVSRIWLPVAPRETVAVGGDIVIGRMAHSQLGQIEVRLPPGFRKGPLAIGPLVVGGRYGQKQECDANGACRVVDLAPGPYKLQLPNIDATRTRFDADVVPGKRLILELRPGSAKKLMIVEQRQTSLAPASDAN